MTARNVAASVFLALGTGLAQAQDASACKGERWSVPRELRTHAGNTVFLEQPSIVSIRDGVFLPAWPTRVYDSAGAVVWPLAPGGKPSSVEHVPAGAVVGTDGIARLVPWPNGLQAGPWRPVATADDSGVAHVIWGSRDNEPVSSLYMVRSLWHARFDGTGWGPPTRVLTTEGTVIWSSAATSPLLARGRSLHLLAAIQGEGLRYVRFDGGVWSDRHVDIPTVYIGYPHLAVLRSGRLVLMVQGNVSPLPDHAISGFYITKSDDGGESWSRLVPISTAAQGPDFDGRLLVDDRDVLYAFWYQQTDASGLPATGPTLGGSPGRIYATQSFDRGVTWQQATPTALIANGNELHVLLRPDHSVLAAVADALGERMLISSWSNGWGPFTTITARLGPLNPSLGTDDAQRPFLTWSIRHTHDWLGVMVTRLVLLTVPCR